MGMGTDIFAGVRTLIKTTFPFLPNEDINQLIYICAINNGLVSAPDDNPDFVFGYFRYSHNLVNAVQDWDWKELRRHDLRQGPILHIGVLITPTPGYRLARELINECNPVGLSGHRYRKDGTLDFRFRKNHRYDPERPNHASQ